MVNNEAKQCLKVANSYLNDIEDSIIKSDDKALAYKLKDKLKLALKQIEKAESIDPNTSIDDMDLSSFKGLYWFVKGKIDYFYFNKNSVAIKDFKQSLDFAERSGPHYLLGSVYENIGNKEDALIEYKKAIEIDPENVDYRKALSELENKSKIVVKLRAFRGSWKVLLFWIVLAILSLIFAIQGESSILIFFLFAAIAGLYWYFKSH